MCMGNLLGAVTNGKDNDSTPKGVIRRLTDTTISNTKPGGTVANSQSYELVFRSTRSFVILGSFFELICPLFGPSRMYTERPPQWPKICLASFCRLPSS